MGFFGGEAHICACACGSVLRARSHLAAKALLHLAKRQWRVLDRVVQQRGRDALGVHPPRRNQLGDRDRMGDEGLAVAAELAVVDAVGELERLLRLLALAVGQVPAVGAGEGELMKCRGDAARAAGGGEGGARRRIAGRPRVAGPRGEPTGRRWWCKGEGGGQMAREKAVAVGLRSKRGPGAARTV